MLSSRGFTEKLGYTCEWVVHKIVSQLMYLEGLVMYSCITTLWWKLVKLHGALAKSGNKERSYTVSMTKGL